MYDFTHLQSDLGSEDLSQLVTDAGDPDEQIFEAAEEMVAFLFRMCALAPGEAGNTTDERFEQLIRSGIQKAIREDYELINFNLEMNYGLPREERERLHQKILDGEQLELAELREALENGYIDDSFKFEPVGEDGFPKNVDAAEVLITDDYRAPPR